LALSGSVAHRAARQLRCAIPVAAALAIAVTAAAVTPAAPARAAFAPKVVIVVGPSGGNTSDYLGHARDYARQARAYGATVSEVYTPHATWKRVLAAAQGANVFIYMGHGNGWPSPYGPYQGRTKDGLGLNPYDGSGNVRVRYYGENLVRTHIRFAPGAVVLLNRLCYASGAGEPGSPNPALSTALRRVDNYGSGFIDAGATVVLADGHTSLDYEIAMLFHSRQRLTDMWRNDPKGNDNVRTYRSTRSPGRYLYVDPDRRASGFYRSLLGNPTAMTAGIRTPAYAGATKVRVTVRTGSSARTKSLGIIAAGAKLVVRGRFATDSLGRTWAPVMTRRGVRGWVAAWATRFTGTARPYTTVVLRSSASTHAHKRTTVAAGTRVRVIGSGQDSKHRAWLRVLTPTGRSGWIAAWLTQP